MLSSHVSFKSPSSHESRHDAEPQTTCASSGTAWNGAAFESDPPQDPTKTSTPAAAIATKRCRIAITFST